MSEKVFRIFVLMEWVLATQNLHKVKEIIAALPADYMVSTAKDKGILESLPETGETLEQNAIQKATYLYDRLGGFVLSDDSGLEVEYLSGAPGVYSARYAGEATSDRLNREKLLVELGTTANRRAQFRTVLACCTPNGVELFEGVVLGHIAYVEKGKNGFGYDSIFIPSEGDGRTFAEMSFDEKQSLSHRRRAVDRWRASLDLTDGNLGFPK